jgi:tyrosyl-tRNA synthetase
MRVHSGREVPQDMPVMSYEDAISKAGTVWICKLLVTTGLATGTGDARRLVQQGAVSVNGEKVPNAEWEPTSEDLEGAVLKVGAKRYVKLKR